MAHGGCAGGSAEKILRLPILPEGSDRRHKQTARPWTLRRKPVPGENLAIITRVPDASWLATTHTPVAVAVAVAASIPYQCLAQHDFGAAHSGLARSGKPPPCTHQSSTTGQPRAPCHGTMSTHARTQLSPCQIPSSHLSHREGKGNGSRHGRFLAARPGRLLVPAVDTFRAQARQAAAVRSPPPHHSAGP